MLSVARSVLEVSEVTTRAIPGLSVCSYGYKHFPVLMLNPSPYTFAAIHTINTFSNVPFQPGRVNLNPIPFRAQMIDSSFQEIQVKLNSAVIKGLGIL